MPLCHICGSLAKNARPMVAFALGGAGSRGDFQVGALRFLHDKGVMPSFISGTSGGALLAAKLAEGGNAIDELEAIWHGLSNENDLFEEEPWLAQLEFVLRRVAWEISGFSVGGVLRAALFPSTIYFDGIRLAAEGTLDVSILIGAVRQALDAKGALNLRPLERMLRGVRHGMEADLDASGLEYAAKFAVVGDFDGDGHDEIAIAPDTPGSPGNDFWVLKYGAGSWYHLSPIPGHGMEADLDASGLEYAAKFAVVGDFDGDTHDEIAIAPDTPGSPGNDFWVLKYGAGSWYHLSPIPGHGMEADLDASGLEYAAKFAVVGDFDGDTHDEIAIAPDTPGSPGNDFWVLKYGAGSWYHLSPIPGHGMEADLDASGLEYAAKFAVVGDFDGDTHDEIAIALDTPRSPGNVSWVVKYGAGSRYHLRPIPGHGMEADLDASGLEYAAKFAVVGDFDGDTHDEIAIAPDTPGSPGNDFWVLKYGAGSWYHLSPIYGQLGVLNPRKVAQSGIQLRLAVVDLESGQLRFVTELGRFLDDDGTAFDLIDGVLASGSMSGVFPPVQLGQDNYTDGGIRDLVPIRVALDAGVDHVFAIYPSPGVIRVNGSFDGRRSELPYLADLGSRCIDIMLDQNRRDEMSPGGVIGQLITSIQSSVEVHDGTTIDPGLISISMDYGYMRAFDVLEGGEQREELVGLSDEITQRRRDVWETEYWANGIERLARPHARGVEQLVLVPSPDALLDVRQQKRVIFDLVQRRIQLKGAGAMPVGMERWWRQWERHPWDTYTDTPWQAFDSSAGHVDAANPPG